MKPLEENWSFEDSKLPPLKDIDENDANMRQMAELGNHAIKSVVNGEGKVLDGANSNSNESKEDTESNTENAGSDTDVITNDSVVDASGWADFGDAASSTDWNASEDFTSKGTFEFNDWGSLDTPEVDHSAEVNTTIRESEESPSTNKEDLVLAACLAAGSEAETLNALQLLNFGYSCTEAASANSEPNMQIETERTSITIADSLATELDETVKWNKSMLELLLYAQLGVAVPKYAPTPMKRKYFTADLPFSEPLSDDQIEALPLRKSPTDSKLIDGLFSGVSTATVTTAKYTIGTVSMIGRGIGASFDAVGSMASRIASFSSEGDRPESPNKRSSRDSENIFADIMTKLSAEERAALGIQLVDGDEQTSPEDLINFLTPEARELVERMRKMEDTLRLEEEELEKQQKILDIERREELLFPEKLKKENDEELVDTEDNFSREMRENGLKHVSKSGTEMRIFHESLPEEFDLTSFLDSSMCKE